jgi:YVTN family beta-propeller protein
LEFRILGPLEVVDNGREISIRGRKLESLLALLLLNKGQVVSRDRLIDDLWGEEPPPSAAKTLQVHVSRLRRELGDIVVTHGGGYLIRVEPEQLDLERFERLVADGKRALAEQQPERASERLREALELWRGPPLPELADEPFARAQVGRLEDAQLDALEALLEAELALGRHAEAIQRLEPLVARNPYRERLRELLMLALYRAGRQADALAAYRDARHVLVEELGLEPGARLRELHAAILAQDPALDRAATAPGQPGSPAEPPEPLRPRAPPPAAIAAGVAALLLVVLGIVLLLGEDGDREVQPLTDDSHAVVSIDPATGRVTTAASVGTNPGPLAFEPESRSLWVGNLDDESVTRVDLRPVRTGRTIAIGERPVGLAAGDGAVWVGGATRRRPYVTARKIDARFDSSEAPVRVESLVGEGGVSLALIGRALWIAPSFGLLTRVDATTGRIERPEIDAGHSPTTIAADARTVWVADRVAGVVSRIDPSTGVASPIPVPGGPAEIALGSDSVWVTLALDDAVARIDPGTGSVRSTISVGRRPVGVAVGAGAVWVANTGDGTVSRIDPASGRVTDTIPVGASPQDVVVADGRVWVSVRPRRDEGPVARGGTVRVETEVDVDFLDPALAYVPLSWQILHTTSATLLRYRSEAGPAGTQLVPELAEALPRRTDGGRTYTFRIRSGFRFSPPSGEAVTARSMKFAIERSLHPRMRSPAAGLMGDLVGGRAYAEGRARHISGVTARGNTLTIRITRPASSLPARISLPFFSAVPIGTPIDPDGLRKVPSAGPYYLAEHAPGEEILLKRNPGYGGTRTSRPDQVRITLAAGQGETLAGIEAGQVDYTPILSNASRARGLDARYGAGSAAARKGRQRYFVNTVPELDYLVFNTSRPPFSSARLRRAVNYALDRRALARESLWSGLPAVPTDQYLPPTMPGFLDARIYPLTPDLATARRLAGAKRRTVVLYVLSDPPHRRFAAIVRANLSAIGMDVDVRELGQSLFLRIARRGEPFDMAVAAWRTDYADPIDFLGQLDGRTIGPDENINYAYFDDPTYDRRLDAAARLPSPARELALGRLDAQVARTAAPWAAVANGRTHDFFSARIGCQVYNPVLGLDLASLCIRRAE